MTKFKKGDRVVTKVSCGFYRDTHLPPGAEGVVLGTSAADYYAVRFTGWAGGHDLFHDRKRFSAKKNSKECWVLSGEDLTLKQDTVPAKSTRTRPLSDKLGRVLTHLSKGLTLTQGEAIILGYGTRLSDLIHRLREKGYDIRTTMKEDLNGTPYGEYKLVTRDRFGGLKKEAT